MIFWCKAKNLNSKLVSIVGKKCQTSEGVIKLTSEKIEFNWEKWAWQDVKNCYSQAKNAIKNPNNKTVPCHE